VATRQEQLAALRRELGRQNADWERARGALAKLGEGTLAVPRDVLRRIDACAPEAGSGININAVRG
jgi:hypothetical protein